MMPRGPSLSDGCTPLVVVEFPQNLEQARPRALGDALERSEELGTFFELKCVQKTQKQIYTEGDLLPMQQMQQIDTEVL